MYNCSDLVIRGSGYIVLGQFGSELLRVFNVSPGEDCTFLQVPTSSTSHDVLMQVSLLKYIHNTFFDAPLQA